jgi:two-component system, LytTR family, sensor kinase
MVIKAIREKRYKGFILHFILWGGLLLLNFIIFGMPGLEFDLSFPLLSWLAYILLFYLNYSLFVPNYLFRKRYFLYGVLLLTTFAMAVYSKALVDTHFFKEEIQQYRNAKLSQKERHSFKIRPSFDKGQLVPGHYAPPPKGLLNVHIEPFFMTSTLQLALIVLASISLRFIKRWQDDEKIKAEIEKEKISTELSFLKQQINPHFLFNAINSIYSLSISKKPETSDAIIKLSSILRYMLYETDKQYVALNDEIQAINNYIELQKLRITEKVKLNFKLKGQPGSYKVVPLIMMPLIENAFKHGVDNANESFIDIFIEINQGNLLLSVRNKIVSKSGNQESSGIGIKNIIRRLELLYPDAYGFESSQNANIFAVNLQLKLEQ